MACYESVWTAVQYPTKSEREIDDLKARYYSIARQLMIAREGNQEDIENHIIVKAPFDGQHEKCALSPIISFPQNFDQ